MLFVVGTDATIVRAPVTHRRVVASDLFRCLDEDFSATLVIVDVVGDHDALGSVNATPLQHPHAAVLKDDFGVDATETC